MYFFEGLGDVLYIRVIKVFNQGQCTLTLFQLIKIRTSHEFSFETEAQVSNYCLILGINIRYNGSFNVAITSLMEKARKAYFKIKKTILRVRQPLLTSGKLLILKQPLFSFIAAKFCELSRNLKTLIPIKGYMKHSLKKYQQFTVKPLMMHVVPNLLCCH